MKKKVVLDNTIFQYLRETTFDTDRFKDGHDVIYTEDEMEDYENNFRQVE
eukprot:CAMPEP_0183743896 /NCGR_PEP_ID=MMETSP0737-20130205/65454_1 /TAXON_ID=385413 /ORGANISM="Thalassiosira miniscula, Strain CCMP1093" /LENGTH=49 /DNA_ID=CAMNT_0025979525 /DNA_START=977 /DNA_END=1126 /DNA_ORIENTATION=+